MSWKQHLVEEIVDVTVPDTWDHTTLVTTVTTESTKKFKNLFIRGIYSVDQSSEVLTQFGLMVLTIQLWPDTVTTPDPDWTKGQTGGIDRQIKSFKHVWAYGNNNPTLFTFRYRAINVKPGEKLLISAYVPDESGTSLNHRIRLGGNYWLWDTN